MSHAVAGHMIEQGYGRIIGVTTSMDTMWRKGGAPYGPSKAGHEALIAIMSQDLEGNRSYRQRADARRRHRHEHGAAARRFQRQRLDSTRSHAGSRGVDCIRGRQRLERPAHHCVPLG